jgi:hypothetical protein
VLATGAEDVGRHMVGIDAVYEKPARLSSLLTLLGVRDTPCLPAEFRTSTQLKENRMKENKTPRAHTVSTLKERLAPGAPKDKQQSGVRTAQGFSVA